ncbi:MAG: hypothetical protein DMG99_05085, partial [Acidobacteria bacterium]
MDRVAQELQLAEPGSRRFQLADGWLCPTRDPDQPVRHYARDQHGRPGRSSRDGLLGWKRPELLLLHGIEFRHRRPLLLSGAQQQSGTAPFPFRRDIAGICTPVAERETAHREDHLAGAGCGGRGVSWKIYSEEKNLYTYLQDFAYYNQPGVSAKVVSIDQFFTDAAGGQLPGVAFIETGLHDGLSEHTSNFDPAQPQQGEVPINVQVGAQFASKVINSVMQGPSWTDSVIFFAHDEGGGFFDHVPPISVPSPDGIKPVDLTSSDVPGDFTLTASRVPNMVISPFAKKNFVSHTPMDYTA